MNKQFSDCGGLKKAVRVLLLSSVVLSNYPVQADVDAGRGMLLHEQSCTRCHDSSVYSRVNKRIDSMAALQEQVSICTRPAGAQWGRQDIDDVVEYLNQEFYRFKQE